LCNQCGWWYRKLQQRQSPALLKGHQPLLLLRSQHMLRLLLSTAWSEEI
jgi:hypothetical protein